jgi:hypothetical protein
MFRLLFDDLGPVGSLALFFLVIISIWFGVRIARRPW